MARKLFDEGGVRYWLDYASSFQAMLTDLYPVVDLVFKNAENDNVRVLTEQRQPVYDALSMLSSAPEGAYSHHEEIEALLNAFLLRLNSIYLDLMSPEARISTLTARSHAKKLRNFTRLIKKVSNRKQRDEWERMVSVRYAAVPVDLLFSHLHPDLQKTLPEWQEEVKKPALRRAEREAYAAREKTENTLNSVSPDLLKEYRKTTDLAEEAKGSNSLTIEDEHFIEQVHADYVPRILSAVEGIKERSSSFEDKETIVREVLKQFHIIQAGIQRIIEKAVTRHLNEIRSQTDFLTQKVLGDESLTLNPGEAQAQLEEVAEEAQRVRETLYQKHVAPVLKAQKEAHERELKAQAEKYQHRLNGLQERLAVLHMERKRRVEETQREIRDATASLHRENENLKAELRTRAAITQGRELGTAEKNDEEVSALYAEIEYLNDLIIALEKPGGRMKREQAESVSRATPVPKPSRPKYDREGNRILTYYSAGSTTRINVKKW